EPRTNRFEIFFEGGHIDTVEWPVSHHHFDVLEPYRQKKLKKIDDEIFNPATELILQLKAAQA
ncbi:MAG: hypothetical protein ABIO36_01900, partial [Pyrinomonadaceae bacterium]